MDTNQNKETGFCPLLAHVPNRLAILAAESGILLDFPESVPARCETRQKRWPSTPGFYFTGYFWEQG